MKIATAKAAGEVVERAWKAQGKLSVAAWFLQVFRTPPPAGLPTAPHLMFAAALLPGRGPLAAPHLVTVASLSPGIGRQNGPLAPQLGSPHGGYTSPIRAGFLAWLKEGGNSHTSSF